MYSNFADFQSHYLALLQNLIYYCPSHWCLSGRKPMWCLIPVPLGDFSFRKRPEAYRNCGHWQVSFASIELTFLLVQLQSYTNL